MNRSQQRDSDGFHRNDTIRRKSYDHSHVTSNQSLRKETTEREFRRRPLRKDNGDMSGENSVGILTSHLDANETEPINQDVTITGGAVLKMESDEAKTPDTDTIPSMGQSRGESPQMSPQMKAIG